eukprot:1961375-Pyramimonas_sp.AAC.1
MTDYSGASKARPWRKHAHDDEDVPTLWVRATSGHSFIGILCPESLRTPVAALGGRPPEVSRGSPRIYMGPSGYTCRASSSTGSPVAQSTAHEERTAGSLRTDARICQETPVFYQVAGATPTYLYIHDHGARAWRSTNDLVRAE